MLVLDLAVVEFTHADGQLVAQVPDVGVLASVPSSGLPSREAVFRALDAALKFARIPCGASWARVALYNPLSGEVAFDAVPNTLAFRSRLPLALPREGALGSVVNGVLRLDGSELLPRSDDFTAVREALSSHAR